MLDMKERYDVVPSVLVPSEGELADRCRENGIEVFCSKFYWRSYNNSFKVMLKGAAKQVLNRIKYFPEIFSLLKDKHFDIVHTNSSVIDTGIAIAQHFSVPHVWHIREYGIDDYNLYYVCPKSYVRAQYAKSDRVIAISRSIYDTYINERGLCSAQNTVCVPNGLKVSEAYSKTYLHDGRVNFCITGLIIPEKNQLLAVNACAKLKAVTDNFTLHIIGRGSDDYIDSLKRTVSSLGLDGHVKFWGFRYDVNDVLKDMDVGLMLSKREAFGRVTVEYMMNYMPVIGMNTGATPEIVTDGKSGFICPLDDADEIADRMYRFIMNPEILSSMGNYAREDAVKRFSLERNTDDIYRLYQEILKH